MHAQNLPTYSERGFSNLPDTTAVKSHFYSGGEGNVNPQEYILGPGDKLFVSISGLQDITLNLIVDQESSIFIPKVGAIDLKNLTLVNAKQKITKTIDKYYKNVDVFISLIGFRKIKVALLGDVNKPSTYIISGNSRLMDLIAASPGLTKTSNYRNIKVMNKDSVLGYYDLLSYLRFGDKMNNPLLRGGDVIFVDKVDKTISINGMIKYPGIYEYLPGETISHFIRLAGGFLSKARKDSIELVSFAADGKSQFSEYYSYDELLNQKIVLHNQDMVIVREIPEYYIDRFVEVHGYVKYPGYYKIVKGKTKLTDIIKEAGGFLENASLEDASITRNQGTVEYDPEYERLKNMDRKDMSDDEYAYLKAKSRERKGRMVVDFVRLFKDHDSQEDIILKKDDFISVPEAKNYIIMLGQLAKPGDLIFNKNLSIDDYIKLAGGYGWRADKGNVRVIRANTGEWVDADDADSLNPGDAIWVPENPPPPRFWDVFTTSMQIFGQVASIIAATVAIIVATRK